MKLIRYKATTPYVPAFSHSTLLDEMDRIFEMGFPSVARSLPNYGSFPVDLYQDKDSVIVRAELPGFHKENLHVQVADDTLTISGHLATNEAENQKNGGDSVRTETSVERAISLPENLDYTKVAAAYEDGVLTVRLPKREEVKPTSVAIEVK